MNTPWASRVSTGYYSAVAPWIAQSNASPVQKNGLWDGCQIAHTREITPTGIRHLARVSIDSAYVDDPTYKVAWRYGFYFCHVNRSAYNNPFLRGWNTIGFKGDSISYKAYL